MKRVVLFTTHYWNSHRRAGFHWIADALWSRGWEVVFFMDGLSWIDHLRRDYRFQYPVVKESNKLVPMRERLYSYVWLNSWRPISLRNKALDNLLYGPFSRYGDLPLGEVEEFIRSADLFIFESSYGLMLFDRVKRMNPSARYVYRVSDDLNLVPVHRLVLDTERRIAREFDLVSVPAPAIYEKFKDLPNLVLQKHGIRCDMFDKDYENPYAGIRGPHLLFVGSCIMDMDFVRLAAEQFPDAKFHIIGPFASPEASSGNVIFYGEVPFDKTIPYIKFADVGLNCRTMPSLTDSLKVQQYTYCRLPIITSSANKSDKPHVFYYEPGDSQSIRNAVEAALSFDRSLVPKDRIQSWDSLVDSLVG
jgi:2-beta-glucuronyltransferase